MLNEKIAQEQVDKLAQAMLTLQSVEEARSFFEDILTVGEVQAIAQRLAVARMLRQGTTYQDIAESTGASTATISRVNRALTYGAGGYLLVLERMEEAAQADTSDDQEEEKR